MSGRAPPPAPTPEQRRAADPTRSVWVDANAGTGKTRVLSDRVLRLMLAGAPPASLLCLTYTKAAAGEMADRVGRRLALWATLDDADLREELSALADASPTPAQVARARGLHDAVLALPSGLAVMTVHSLGQHLLRRFPIEAGVPASFDVIDERTRGELLAEARDRILAAVAADDAAGADLDIIAAAGADSTLLEAVDALIGERLAWAAARQAAGGRDGAIATLATLLDVAPDMDETALTAAACRDDAFERGGLERVADVFASASQKTRRAAGAAMRAWLDASPEGRAATLDGYRASFAVADKATPPRLRANGHLKLDKLRVEAPELAAVLEVEIDRLDRLEQRRRGLATFQRSRALVRLADRVLGVYERLKSERAVLDFDDLLLRARDLLARPGAGAWVRFKLDQAFTHILVDEAQDTNPLQWSLIELLLDEVFVGVGTKDSGARTVFVVGDVKQSIFRFQGADPQAGAATRARIEGRAAAAGMPIATVPLAVSFRSSQAVLDVAERLIAAPDVRRQLGEAPAHQAFTATRGGRVEVWPLMPAPVADTTVDPWTAPPSREHPERAEQGLARVLAREIAGWIASGERLPGSGRALGAGDVMILLRRRGTLQELLVRALKRAGVPVVGADRLTLTRHLAVQDLIALGEAVLLPENDFALACALKSPLFGVDEDRLFSLAQGRAPGETLEARLRAAAGDDPALRVVWERWRAWQRLTDFVPPYEFYLRVLGGDLVGSDGAPAFCGRAAILARFGAEAGEPLEAFVEQALAYEQGHPATLQGFLDWLGRGDATLKRDPQTASDGVRVLTVHGAKGLEAPLVVLADAGPRSAPRPGRLLWSTTPALPMWRPRREDATEATAAALAADVEARAGDDHRLLYVAATRAAEWLVVCGTEPRRSSHATSWHARFHAALTSLDARSAPAPSDLEGERLIYATGLRAALEPAPRPPAGATPPPAWLTTPPPRSPYRPVLRASDAAPTVAGGDPSARARARTLGQHVHALLERLPALPPEARDAALTRVLERPSDLDDELRARIREQVERVLAAPELAPLLAAEAWVEQPIVGLVGGARIAGQVDRMAVVGDEVWIADYKTGRPPAKGAPPPEAHLRQLAAYAALVAPLFPGKVVRATLIWTETGTVQTVDAADLASHIPLARE